MTTLPPFNSSRPSNDLGIRLVCWVIILALAGLEIWSNMKQAAGEGPETAATTQASSTKPSTTPSPEPEANAPAGNVPMELAGKLAVAQHAWSKNGNPEAIDAAIHQLDAVAKSPRDRIDVAIVERETRPPEESDKRFATIRTENMNAEDRSDLAALLQIRASGADSLNDRQRADLVARHGWFGKLALCYGLPPSDPVRATVITSTHRTLIVASVAAGLGVSVLVIGFLLMVVAIVLAGTGKLQLRYRPAAPGSVYLEAFAIYMCSFIVLSLILHALFSSPSLLWTFISLLILLPITLAWPVLRGESWSSVRGRYGWHRGEGVLVEMGAGIGTYLAFVPALLLSVLVMTVLIKIASLFNLPGSSPTHPVINLLSGPPATLIGVYLLASVGAPLIEESMFRGALFNHLRGRHGWIISALIVSLLFAAVHPQGWTVIPPLAMLSVTFCAMREWRSSLIGSMTAHALNNGIVLTISVLMLR